MIRSMISEMEGSTLGCFFKGKGCRFRTTNARVLDIRTMILQIDFLASTTANAVEDKSRRGKSRRSDLARVAFNASPWYIYLSFLEVNGGNWGFTKNLTIHKSHLLISESESLSSAFYSQPFAQLRFWRHGSLGQ